jgi:hypothetical protein
MVECGAAPPTRKASLAFRRNRGRFISDRGRSTTSPLQTDCSLFPKCLFMGLSVSDISGVLVPSLGGYAVISEELGCVPRSFGTASNRQLVLCPCPIG